MSIKSKLVSGFFSAVLVLGLAPALAMGAQAQDAEGIAADELVALSSSAAKSGGFAAAPELVGVWKSDANGYWFQRSDGSWPASSWGVWQGDLYYFDASGYMATGWFRASADANGDKTPGSDGKGAWYYANSAGSVQCGNWFEDSHGWCYTDPDTGEMYRNQWAFDSSGPCYIGDEGYCMTSWFRAALDCNGEETLGTDGLGAWYYANSAGSVQCGNWFEDSQGWCYTDPETGEMWHDRWASDSAGPCYIADKGYCATGWFLASLDCNGKATPGSDGKGAWYHSSASGQLDRGRWMKDSLGWCYVDDSTGEMWANKWIKDSVAWCFIGSEGYCLTGEQTVATKDGQADNPGPGVWTFAADGRLISGTPTPEEAVLTLEVIDADGAVEASKGFTLSELRAIAAEPDGDPLLFQYYKNDAWNVLYSHDYVTFDDLLAAAGIEANAEKDVFTVDGYTKWAGATLATMNSGKFYPVADGPTFVDNDAEPVTAGLALSYATGKGASPAAALKSAQTAASSSDAHPRVMMGVYDTAKWGGFVSASNVEKIVLTRAPANAGTDIPGESESTD